VDGIRWSNVNDPSKWAADSIAQRSTVVGPEVLDAAERRLETIMLGIRTSQGLSISELLGHGLVSQGDVEEVIRNGWATDQDGQLVLTITGRLLADSVVQVLAR
jgi:oxygen-independent coproporphyrinogen-3 oxidase